MKFLTISDMIDLLDQMACSDCVTNEIRPIGYHKHNCYDCNTVWEYGDDMAGNEDAHKCPKCGKEEWLKYSGSRQPTFTTRTEETT